MTDKLKITKEQEDTLNLFHESFMQVNGLDYKLKQFITHRPCYKDDDYFSSLYSFTPEQFALLLCGWYEVEQPFQVGEFVVDEQMGKFGTVYKVGEVIVTVKWNTGAFSDYTHKTTLLRHATDEEIEQEKKSRTIGEFETMMEKISDLYDSKETANSMVKKYAKGRFNLKEDTP